MAMLVDTLGKDPRKAPGGEERPRHPEKAHRPMRRTLRWCVTRLKETRTRQRRPFCYCFMTDNSPCCVRFFFR